MLRNYFAATLLTLAALAAAAPARAQQSTSDSQDKTIGDRIGDFGRGIKGLFSADPQPTPAANTYPGGGLPPPAASTWTGTPTPSRFAAPSQDDSSGGVPRGITTESVSRQRMVNDLSDGYVPAVREAPAVREGAGDVPSPGMLSPPAESPAAAAGEHPVGYSVAVSNDGLSSSNAATEVIPVPRNTSVIQSDAGLVQVGADSMPLHERMAAFRQSPFDSSDSAASPTPASQGPAIEPTPIAPNRDDGNAAATAKTPTYAPAGSRPSLAQRTAAGFSSSGIATDGPFGPTIPDTLTTAGRTSIAPPLGPPPASANPSLAGPGASASVPAPLAAATDPALPPSYDSPATSASDRSGQRQGPGVLLSRQSPNLSVETVGPRRIAVGRESTYEITLRNSGSVAAEELLVIVDMPAWADVERAEASLGNAQQTASSGTLRQLLWRVGRLESQGVQRLTLKIVPHESRPLNLAIHWDYKQVSTQAVIEVQEPRLALHIEGPREVLYGKKQDYRLRVANTGSGEAENTAIELLPLGAGESVVAHHNFGTIPAGAEKAVEVEMTARQSGLLTIKVQAQCEGGAHAEISEQVLVRRAALAIRVDAPKIQFVGGAAVYRIHVSNPGNAVANNLMLGAAIPPGAKLISVSDSGQADNQGAIVHWKIDSLNPTGERDIELKCGFQQEGTARLDLAANAEDDLSAAATAATQVDAMANLVMDVVDPVGPIPVGEEAAYELKVANRGTKSAEEIEIVAFFSQGIEPTTVEGGPHKIAPGQVTFDVIPSIAPGQELRLKINAKAQIAGSHVFRAEVHCRPLSTRLVREETTYFYANQGAAEQDLGIAGAGKKNADGEPVRSADRGAATAPLGVGSPARTYR